MFYFLSAQFSGSYWSLQLQALLKQFAGSFAFGLEKTQLPSQPKVWDSDLVFFFRLYEV